MLFNHSLLLLSFALLLVQAIRANEESNSLRGLTSGFDGASHLQEKSSRRNLKTKGTKGTDKKTDKKTKMKGNKKGKKGKKSKMVGQEEQEGGRVTIMSRNIFLGTDLFPILTATDAASFGAAVPVVLRTLRATDFVTRSGELAREILEAKPDVIGLQEGARYLFNNPDGSVKDDLNFIEILMMQLKALGLNYSVATTSLNWDIVPIPLGAQGTLVYQMSDFILVNDDSSTLTVKNVYSELYPEDIQILVNSALGPLALNRGVTYLDAAVNDQKFRFVNTHLDVTNNAINAAQALALLNIAVSTTDIPVFVVGDMNALSDGTGIQPGNSDTYKTLTEGLNDAWVSGKPLGSVDGLSCCRSTVLDGGDLDKRIDYIFYRGKVENVSIKQVGVESFQSNPPMYASDHAGLVAEFILQK